MTRTRVDEHWHLPNFKFYGRHCTDAWYISEAGRLRKGRVFQTMVNPFKSKKNKKKIDKS